MDARFLCVYVVEAILKLIALDLDYFRDLWNDVGEFPADQVMRTTTKSRHFRVEFKKLGVDRSPAWNSVTWTEA